MSLTDEISRNAEFIALKAAKNNGIIISYDPNYRASLWDSQEEACKWMRSILEYADIVKVSEEEIELLTGYTDVRKAAESITEYGAKIVLITLGEKGSFVYLQDQHMLQAIPAKLWIPPVPEILLWEAFYIRFVNPVSV